MGDSYSSGEGACAPKSNAMPGGKRCRYLPGTDSSSPRNRCHRSANAYSEVFRKSLPPTWRFAFVACSGAVVDNVLRHGQYNETAQLTQLDTIAGNRKQEIRLVTISIGGNDDGFASTIAACVKANLKAGLNLNLVFPFPLNGHCDPTPSLPDAAMRRRLVDVYTDIHRIAPKATLLVLGYPQLFDRGAPTISLSNCDIRAADAQKISKLEDHVNHAVIGKAVAEANAKSGGRPYAVFVNNDHTFDHRELCRRKVFFKTGAPSALNGLLLGSKQGYRNESFHPNSLGHSLLAAKLARSR